MDRQHGFPVLLDQRTKQTVPLMLLGERGRGDWIVEADIQALVHTHPACLPIAEIDPVFLGPVPICTELNTPAGAIDNFMVTPSGLPVLVECKLWRNPEARREVVGQILDYAKELSRWSSSDLQREVSARLKREGNPLLELVRRADPTVDEMQFNDALTGNLRRGRFLLLIVGDGIREGVEAIAEYLTMHAGLHFSLGLVELPIYAMPDGNRLVVPRVLVRTSVLTRTVVAVPDGHVLQEDQQSAECLEVDPDRSALQDEQVQFWTEFLNSLTLDDPEQQIPKPARMGYLGFMLPASGGSSWLTVYRNLKRGEVGVFLSSHRQGSGDHARQAIVEAWDEIAVQLGGTARLGTQTGRQTVIDSRIFGSLNDPTVRAAAFAWLAERVNSFVNVLRPRVRAAAADYQAAAG